MKNLVVVISSLVLAATLSGCQSRVEQIENQAKVVNVCVDNGGEWFNDGSGFGSTCHFDTRKKS